MKRGFYTIMTAQFFSSLADNALFIAAVELLRDHGARAWQHAALVPMFALFYVLLAPWAGAFADSRRKGQVMFISNAIKMLGCLLMLFGGHPLLAYAIVGLGAAAYSPAKYGILTELLPPSQLVQANGWIEGLTIGSIILGILLGGKLVGGWNLMALLSLHGRVHTGIHHASEAAIVALFFVYVVAAGFNLRIPDTGAVLRPMPRNPLTLLPDFYRCTVRLWCDKLGQITLASTTLLWGVSANLRFIVLAWAAAALHYEMPQATRLTGVVVLGSAAGAVLASLRGRLDRAVRVIPLGIVMGLLLAAMGLIDSLPLAIPALIALGALGGYIMVPMNALLQHRGHNLMGAGSSIAVQNFNEQAAILGLGALYSFSTRLGLHTLGAVQLLGGLLAAAMAAIGLWHRYNLRCHGPEVRRLQALARGEGDGAQAATSGER
ncbi:MAG: lysophospholipid transporter LplT [Burkholderiaceae bacterium]|jgi:MFS family permease|nr:lysophospholipid transporter LplT [Burkholderiaceae bacterium]